MPERLLSVISGILAGGIPSFRSELCCFYHPLAGMALFMLVFSPFCLCLRPYHDVMTQGCHLLHESANELVASHSSFVGWFLFVFVLFWWFVLVVFWFVVDDDGFLDYVQVLHQFSFVALNQQTASRINLEINAFAMPLSVLNDLVEAMKAVDGKKVQTSHGYPM